MKGVAYNWKCVTCADAAPLAQFGIVPHLQNKEAHSMRDERNRKSPFACPEKACSDENRRKVKQPCYRFLTGKASKSLERHYDKCHPGEWCPEVWQNRCVIGEGHVVYAAGETMESLKSVQRARADSSTWRSDPGTQSESHNLSNENLTTSSLQPMGDGDSLMGGIVHSPTVQSKSMINNSTSQGPSSLLSDAKSSINRTIPIMVTLDPTIGSGDDSQASSHTEVALARGTGRKRHSSPYRTDSVRKRPHKECPRQDYTSFAAASLQESPEERNPEPSSRIISAPPSASWTEESFASMSLVACVRAGLPISKTLAELRESRGQRRSSGQKEELMFPGAARVVYPADDEKFNRGGLNSDSAVGYRKGPASFSNGMGSSGVLSTAPPDIEVRRPTSQSLIDSQSSMNQVSGIPTHRMAIPSPSCYSAGSQTGRLVTQASTTELTLPDKATPLDILSHVASIQSFETPDPVRYQNSLEIQTTVFGSAQAEMRHSGHDERSHMTVGGESASSQEPSSSRSSLMVARDPSQAGWQGDNLNIAEEVTVTDEDIIFDDHAGSSRASSPISNASVSSGQSERDDSETEERISKLSFGLLFTAWR